MPLVKRPDIEAASRATSASSSRAAAAANENGKGNTKSSEHRGHDLPLGNWRKWNVSIKLRAFALALEITAIAVALSSWDMNLEYVYGIWASGFPSFLWDTAETLVLATRGDRGIPSKAHIGVELTLSIAVFASLGEGASRASWLGGPALYGLYGLPEQSTAEYDLFAFLALCAMGACRIVFFIRAVFELVRERKDRPPALMFVPNLDAMFFVVPRSLSGKLAAAGLINKSENIELGDIRRERNGEAAPDETNNPPQQQESNAARERMIARKPVPKPVEELPPIERPVAREQIQQPPQSHMPLPPHVPDEEEVQRQIRGDAQPQFVPQFFIEQKFSGIGEAAETQKMRLREERPQLVTRSSW